jgi:hypothetical protein
MKLTETWLLPLAFTLLCAGFVVSIIAALITADWRYLLISAACYFIIAAK